MQTINTVISYVWWQKWMCGKLTDGGMVRLFRTEGEEQYLQYPHGFPTKAAAENQQQQLTLSHVMERWRWLQQNAGGSCGGGGRESVMGGKRQSRGMRRT
jgi:hypothetical protein